MRGGPTIRLRKESMGYPKLRVYFGPHAECETTELSVAEPTGIRVPLGEVLPLLADAVLSRKAWLADFEEEGITISQDLYDVLLAYRHFRRPSA
jgi:hypothetical protein